MPARRMLSLKPGRAPSFRRALPLHVALQAITDLRCVTVGMHESFQGPFDFPNASGIKFEDVYCGFFRDLIARTAIHCHAAASVD